MIKVFFAPGCYGNFFTKCLFNLTTLSNEPSSEFLFDHFGSSHDRRSNLKSKAVIDCGHVGFLNYENSDRLVVMLPNNDNQLDYLDNQYYKERKTQLIGYLQDMFQPSEIEKKLKENWNYQNGLNENTPSWILREWASFWIQDFLDDLYNIKEYQSLPSVYQFDVAELFNDLYTTLSSAAAALNISVTADPNQIRLIQQRFVDAQTNHKIQSKCIDWANAIVNGDNKPSPCSTIFNEAYVQHLLRNKGYEVQCNDLNFFPVQSQEIKKIIYQP